MLYYFHQYKGIPKTAYTEIDGIRRIWNINEVPTYSFKNPTTEAWDRMLKTRNYNTDLSEGTNLVSILMAYVGSNVNMQYSLEGSGAITKELLYVYKQHGINCDYSAYNAKLVRQSLDNNLPVNIRASIITAEQEKSHICPKIQSAGGHSWIIDGYKEVVTEYTYTYERRPREGREYEEEEEKIQLDDHVPLIDDSNRDFPKEKRVKEEETIVIFPKFGKYTESRTDVTYYWKMNWGWDGHNDDGHYLTEESSIWNTNNGKYLCKKEIIHNFRF